MVGAGRVIYFATLQPLDSNCFLRLDFRLTSAFSILSALRLWFHLFNFFHPLMVILKIFSQMSIAQRTIMMNTITCNMLLSFHEVGDYGEGQSYVGQDDDVFTKSFVINNIFFLGVHLDLLR